MPNFFRDLRDMENIILVEKHYITPDGENIVYSEDTKNLLHRLILFIQSGGCVTSSEPLRFICSKFRCSSHEMASFWNSNNNPEKSENTFRSQISTLSKKFYKIFGTNIYYSFVGQIESELSLIRMKINVLSNKDYCFEDFFYTEIATICQGDGKFVSFDYSLQECQSEISLLQKLMKYRFADVLAKQDAEKLKYIYQILSMPIINPNTLNFNEEKLKLLRALGIMY
jgi:hypothetical protein